MNRQQQAEISGAPVSCRGALERAYSGGSRTAGIKAMCLRCVGYSRVDVRDCSALACPLHPYRPFQPGAEDPEENGQEPDTAALAGAPPPIPASGSK